MPAAANLLPIVGFRPSLDRIQHTRSAIESSSVIERPLSLVTMSLITISDERHVFFRPPMVHSIGIMACPPPNRSVPPTSFGS
jgi:hypothetical protein